MLEVLALRFIASNSHSVRFGKTKHEKFHDFLELSRFTDEAFICQNAVIFKEADFAKVVPFAFFTFAKVPFAFFHIH